MKGRHVTLSGPALALFAMMVALLGPRVFKFLAPDVRMVWPLAYGLSFAITFLIGKLALSLAHVAHGLDDDAAAVEAYSRAEEAAKALEMLRQGQRPCQPIVLYLRPFVSDGAMALKNPVRTSEFDEPEEIDFQEFLARIEWPGEFMAIGDKGFVARGATKLFISDTEWKDDFHRLADVAVSVIVMPHSSQSCIYEVEMLRRWDYLPKTIFVMPPALDGDTSTFDAELEWQKARDAFGQLGLQLPDYSGVGLLFRLGSDGFALEHDEIRSPLLKGRQYKTSTVRRFFEATLVAMVLALFVRTFVFQAFKIPTGSMEPNLLVGDHLIVNKFIFAPAASALERALLPMREIHRGDMIVFKFPEEPERDFIKRVIGLPGETVELKNQTILINGHPLTEPYAHYLFPPTVDGQDSLDVRRKWGPETVPEGRYFMMGDNRDDSQDSRFWGFLPQSYVKGRALFVYWSFDVPDDGTAGGLAPRWGRLFHQIH